MLPRRDFGSGTLERPAGKNVNIELKSEPATEPGSPVTDPGLVGSELNKLARHSSHYIAGLAASTVVGFVSFPIFTRAFSVAEYGIIDLAQKLLLLLVAAAKMGIQNATLRFYDERKFAKDPGAAPRYYSTMFFGALSTSAGVALVCLAVQGFAPSSWISGPLAGLIQYISVLVVLRALGSILGGFLRIEERTKAFNVTTVGTRAATVAVICVPLPLTGRTAQTYFGGIILVEAAMVAILTTLLLRRGMLVPARCDLALFRTGIAFGMPLVVYESAFTMLASADRFLVQHFLGADALGFYSVAYGLAQHVNDLLVTPLNLALMPIYMRLWTAEGRERTIQFLSVALDLFLLAGVGILAVAAASAHDFVVFLASSKYAGADRLIPLLLSGLLIYTMHIFLAAGLLIYERTLQMAGILLASAVVNIGLNWVLLQRIGLMGGAVAVLLSYAVCILALGYASHRLLPLRINVKSLGKYLSAAAVAYLVASQVRIQSPIVSLAARSTVALSLYIGIMLFADLRLRRAAGRLCRWLAVAIRAGEAS